jgi:hypothetical protein
MQAWVGQKPWDHTQGAKPKEQQAQRNKSHGANMLRKGLGGKVLVVASPDWRKPHRKAMGFSRW